MTTARGVLFPDRLPVFARIPPPDGLEHLVRWFWISQWDVEPGQVSRQEIVGFPACNLVVEHDRVGVSGPTTVRSHQDLTGRGWAVAALLRPAAVPALVGDPEAVRDRYVVLEDDTSLELHRLLAEVMEPQRDTGRAVDRLGRHVAARVGRLHDEALLANRMAALADSRPDITAVDDLAAELRVSVRTTQRLARRYVGVSPHAMIRRRRLQEAAERIRLHPELDLATIAHDLGYADHAHLTGDFRTVLGFTPSSYRQGYDDASGNSKPG